jgi:hypothetical protein
MCWKIIAIASTKFRNAFYACNGTPSDDIENQNIHFISSTLQNSNNAVLDNISTIGYISQ